MSENEIERKIAVVFATDVVNYSKHTEVDETETIKSLQACERILNSLFSKHKGRLFNTSGDSFFAEFPSAVSAVECAVEFQNKIKKRNISNDTNVKLEFRIGINSGDVVKQRDNLLGDGVNIAARLESFAQPNGITVSKIIYDYVKNKTEYEFHDLGVQKVKKNEFHALDIVNEHYKKRGNNRKVGTKALFIVGVAICTLVIGLVTFFGLFQEKQSKVSTELATVHSSSPIMLVYPFENLSTAKDGGHLSVAITESMISSLARYSGISVLSNSTSLDAKLNAFSDPIIKKNYNADFVIRGSIQSISNQSRIQMQLTDLSLNKVVWTDKVDFALEDIFKVQDKIGDNILKHLQINAVAGSEAKSWAAKYGTTERLTLYLNSRKEWFKFTADAYENHTAIIKELENKLGSDSPVLYNIKGWNLFLKIAVGKSKDLAKDTAELIKLADLDIAENNDVTAFNLRALVEFRVGSKDCDKSKQFAKRATKMGATADTYIVSGSIWVECGDLKGGTKFFEKALRLKPNDTGWNLTKRLVPMYYLQGKLDKIELLVEPHLDAVDIAPEMLVFYAYSRFKSGDEGAAIVTLNKAVNMGVSKTSLERVLRDPQKTEIFLSELSVLGNIE